MKAKITSIQTTQDGIPTSVERAERESGAFVPGRGKMKAQSQMSVAIERWKALQAEVADKKWSQCPDNMVVDFVRAVGDDISAQYGLNAAAKAAQMVASCLLENGGGAFEIGCQWQEARISANMRMICEPDEEEIKASSSVSIKIEGVSDGLPKSVQQVLVEISEKNDSARLPAMARLQQLAGLPAAKVVDIVGQLERAVPKFSDTDILIGAAAFMLGWQKAEENNAATLEMRMRGLTQNDKPAFPGMLVRVKIKAVRPDAALVYAADGELSADEKPFVIEANIPHKSVRLH